MTAPADSTSLRARLETLVRESAVVALKTGTEVEDMSFAEIALLRELSQGLLPLFVKIGGPEARNDIRELNHIGVDGLIAPMIESPYALQNFIGSLRDCLSAADYERIEKGINLETITGFQNMNAILELPEAAELDQVTAARSDLSGAMGGLATNDPRVSESCAAIVARCRKSGLRTSIGGGILPDVAEGLIAAAAPDTINTRHMVLDCAAMRATGSVADCVRAALEFELLLSLRLASLDSAAGVRATAHEARARTLEQRLARSPVEKF